MNFPRKTLYTSNSLHCVFCILCKFVDILLIRDKKIFSVYFGGKGKRRIDSLCPKSSSVSQPSEICGGFTLFSTVLSTRGVEQDKRSK